MYGNIRRWLEYINGVYHSDWVNPRRPLLVKLVMKWPNAQKIILLVENMDYLPIILRSNDQIWLPYRRHRCFTFMTASRINLKSSHLLQLLRKTSRVWYTFGFFPCLFSGDIYHSADRLSSRQILSPIVCFPMVHFVSTYTYYTAAASKI